MNDVLFSKFDKIYLLTLSSRKERLQHMKNMLKDFNINTVNINIQKATAFPYNNIIIKAFNQNSTKRCFTKPNEYDCARNHYAMIKQALDEGCEHILIMEDDICFLNNIEIFSQYISNIPDDYDIIQFSGFTADSNAANLKDLITNNTYWVKHPNIFVWTTAMYALSKKGMQYYISFMDKWFTVADMPLYKAPLNYKIINSYIAVEPLAIQADKNTVYSDIRNNSNDHIDYEVMNQYEKNIDRNNYYKFKN